MAYYLDSANLLMVGAYVRRHACRSSAKRFWRSFNTSLSNRVDGLKEINKMITKHLSVI